MNNILVWWWIWNLIVLGCKIFKWDKYLKESLVCKPYWQFVYDPYSNSNSDLFIHYRINVKLVSSSYFLRRVPTWYLLLHTIIFVQSHILRLQTGSTTFNRNSHYPITRNMSRHTYFHVSIAYRLYYKYMHRGSYFMNPYLQWYLCFWVVF